MNKLKKYIGRVFYIGIAQWLPASYSKFHLGQKQFRAFCARLILPKCGKDVNIERKAYFSCQVQIGDHSGIGENSELRGPVIIGKNVMMGSECSIYTQNHCFSDPDIPMCQQGFQKEEPVIIGDDVWIGGRVTILPGVHVGSHSIIGANAVVTKNVPEYAIVAGNPAVVKKIRK